jgi:pimeloyl-ACP methyl ester carboxylesterase
VATKFLLMAAVVCLAVVAWLWQRYLRIVVNLFLGVVVRSTPDDEQALDGEEVTLLTPDGVQLAATVARPALADAREEGGRPVFDPEAQTRREPVAPACWRAPGGDGGGQLPPVVVFCHEFGADRRSAGPYVSGFQKMGFAVLAFDFRGHGDSRNTDDYVPRQWATDRELTDLETVVAYVRGREDLDGSRVVLFGVSRGGVVATVFAAQAPLGRPTIPAVIVDGIFSTRRTLLEYMHRWVSIFADVRVIYSRLPEWIFRMYEKLTLLVSELRLGVRFLSLEEAVRVRRCPLLMIHGEADTYIDVAHARWLYEQAAGPKELWIVPEARHNQAVTVAGKLYHERILEFLSPILPASRPTSVPATSNPR